ncbi:MAG: hypothetical protein JXA98_02660 [Methanosarcinaceae archaeon]|nr:hypothetical protein [Methanosarcinaceae archaeon]
MKELIKNDDAVSVVVGSILILAVLVTFMSVVTSTWVPVYEGNAEADHSDALFDTFVDLSKQIENADEYPKSTTIKIGTDEIPFISNTNSVGYMGVNESGGILTLTTEIQRSLPGFGEGDSFSVKDLNLSQDAPITDFRINFILDNITNTDSKFVLPNGFALILQSDTLDRLKISIEEVGIYDTVGTPGKGWKWNSGESSGLRIRYDYTDVSGNVERWEKTWDVVNDIESGAGGTGVDGITWSGDGAYTYLNIDLLDQISTLTLEYTDLSPITINGTDYYETVTNTTSLNDLSQHYLKQPGDGTYDFYYTTYDKIVDCDLILLYNTTTDTIGGNTPSLDNMTIGSGTLTLNSDYNFFVDQSYIYDSGAIILLQDDGAVFKVGGAPIFVSSDPDNNLILDLRAMVLQGDRETSGNDIEMIQTRLKDSYRFTGFTNNVTLTKDTIPELKDLWDSYFEETNSTINLNTTANSTYYPDNMTLHVWSSTPNILLSVEQKEITVS